MNYWRKQLLQAPCPKCRRPAGRWCRDEQGKVLHLAHAERSRAVLQQLATPLTYIAKAGLCLVLALCFSWPALAADSTGITAPAPPQQRVFKFWTTRLLLEQAVTGSLRTWDTVLTCKALHRGAIELTIPAQTCAGVVPWQVGSQLAFLGFQALAHKLGRHKIERAIPLAEAGGSVAAIAWDYQQKRGGQ